MELTIGQVMQLADACGIVLSDKQSLDSDDLSTLITITGEVELADDGDNESTIKYPNTMYFSEYPEEGSFGLKISDR